MTTSMKRTRSASAPKRGTTVTVHRTSQPAKDMPPGMWSDVLDLLQAHGLRVTVDEVATALAGIIRHTPVEAGGRLQPDGSVDSSGMGDVDPSWYCRTCFTDVYSAEEKERHDARCDGLTQGLPMTRSDG